jgi:hypothetical protein
MKGDQVTVLALSWPDAAATIAAVWAVAFLLAVVVWSIFRTGQTAIRHGERTQ